MHTLFQTRPSARGMTLVELLTVIALIGILAAIIIPVTNKVRENARASQCLSNVRQLAMANLLYASENKGQLIVHLPITVGGTPIMPDNVRAEGNWQKAVSRYLSMDKASARSRFVCPSADMSGVTQAQINAGQHSTYTVSMWLHHQASAYGRVTAMPAPVVMVAEMRVSNSDGTYPWNVNAQGTGSYDTRIALFRHAGSTRRNVAMTDGSAHALSPIQDGVFREGAGLMKNYWLPPGATTSATIGVPNPTDTIPSS